MPETLSIEGRAAFYEATGAFRDMVVTHLFQLLGFVAMEPPTSLDAKPLRDEMAKVFDSLLPLDPAARRPRPVRRVPRGPGVAPDSDTETFVAVRTEVDNWRWKGVPFFLRTGKACGEPPGRHDRASTQPPLRMFPAPGGHAPSTRNRIVVDFADPGSISIDFLAKEPGPR